MQHQALPRVEAHVEVPVLPGHLVALDSEAGTLTVMERLKYSISVTYSDAVLHTKPI